MLLSFVGTAVSLWVAVWLVPGFEFDGSFGQFLLVALILGLVNAIIKPIMKLFSLPLIVLTLGLFILVVNALALQIVTWLAGPSVWDLGLTTEGFFWSTFWASVVISIVTWLVAVLVPERDT